MSNDLKQFREIVKVELTNTAHVMKEEELFCLNEHDKDW